jgi:hypothetical protein
MTEDHKPSSRGKRARTKRGTLPATQVEVAQATQVETEATPVQAAELAQPVSEPVLWPVALLPLAIPHAGVAFVAAASRRLAQRGPTWNGFDNVARRLAQRD